MNNKFCPVFKPGSLARSDPWSMTGLIVCVSLCLSNFLNAQTNEAIPRSDFFPIEQLTESSRKLSEELLLAALDSEALYTIAGQIKPVSEGFWGTYFPMEFADLTEIEKVREAVKPWSSGGAYAADVLVFGRQQSGRRYASLYVAHVPTLRSVVSQHSEFFNRFGLAHDFTTDQLMTTIERSTQPGERWRGLGLVFGYPDYAIDFFVGAGLHQRETGEFIERDFRHIPTFGSKQGRFVYAVPKVSPLRPEDIALQQRAEPIFKEYRRLRAQYIGEGKPGPVALLRDWFDDGSGTCHEQHLIAKLPQLGPTHDPADEEAKASPEIPAPQIVFNHLYVVLDEAAFHALRNSDFAIHELAATDQGFPKFKAIDDTCQSIYVRGKETYLEFLGPNNAFDAPVGNIGIAWSVETPGAIDAVEKLLRRANNEVSRHLRRWDFDREGAVNWYHVVHRNFPEKERLQWCFSEYHPDFTPALYPESELGAKGIRRRDFLGARFDPTRHLENINSIALELTPSDARTLTQDLKEVGFRIEAGDGRVSFALGSDCTVVIHTEPTIAASKLSRIGFSTNQGRPLGIDQSIGGGVKISGDNDRRGWIDFGIPNIERQGN